jgi:hypothetical protein
VPKSAVTLFAEPELPPPEIVAPNTPEDTLLPEKPPTRFGLVELG